MLTTPNESAGAGVHRGGGAWRSGATAASMRHLEPIPGRTRSPQRSASRRRERQPWR